MTPAILRRLAALDPSDLRAVLRAAEARGYTDVAEAARRVLMQKRESRR